MSASPEKESKAGPGMSFLWKWLAVALVVIFALVALALYTGYQYIIEVAFNLSLGWITFPLKTLPDVSVDTDAVASAAVTLALLLAGGHFLLSWFYGHWISNDSGAPSAARWPFGRTAAIVSMLGLTFAAGIGFIGAVHQAAWLASSEEPFVYLDMRWAACPSQKSDLANLALSQEAYLGDHGRYTDKLDDLNLFETTPGVTITVLRADEASFVAQAKHEDCPREPSVWDSANGGMRKQGPFSN